MGGRYIARGLLKNTNLRSLNIAANDTPPDIAKLIFRAATIASEGRSFMLDIPCAAETEEEKDKIAAVNEILATAFP